MILLHYLTRLFYLFTYFVSSKDGKKRPSRIESSPLSPVSLASAELVGIFLNLPIGSYHVGALLLLLEEPAWEGSRVVILASVR